MAAASDPILTRSVAVWDQAPDARDDASLRLTDFRCRDDGERTRDLGDHRSGLAERLVRVIHCHAKAVPRLPTRFRDLHEQDQVAIPVGEDPREVVEVRGDCLDLSPVRWAPQRA